MTENQATATDTEPALARDDGPQSEDQAPRAFVRLAAEQWPAIVQENIAKAKTRAGE